MNLPTLVAICAMLVQAVASAKPMQNFHWNWNDAQSLRPAQSLRNAQMSAGDKSAIAKALEAEIRPYLSDAGDDSQDRLEQEALRTRIKLIDLNEDGTPEVIAQSMVACGASGNCPFWILQKDSSGYKLLLDDNAETFTIQTTRTNGYSDIVLALHDSAFEQTLDVYHYSGGAYKGTPGCYSATVAVLEGGAIRKLAEPRIKACAEK